jgi:hypothetical protein
LIGLNKTIFGAVLTTGFDGTAGAGFAIGFDTTLGTGFAGVAGFATGAGLAGDVERVSVTDLTQTVTDVEFVCAAKEKPPPPPAAHAQDGIGLNWWAAKSKPAAARAIVRVVYCQVMHES